MDIDIFESDPKTKFFEIIFNANKNLVENEIEKVFSELVCLREICEEKGVLQGEVLSFLALNPEKIENGLNDIYIEKMGDILSQNE